MPSHQRKIRGEATSLKPSLPLIELCDAPTPERVLNRAIARLRALDAEQIVIAEIVISAIARGRLSG